MLDTATHQSPIYTSDGHANVGYLTMREFNRFRWAWDKGGQIASFLYTAGNLDSCSESDVRVDSSSAPTINLPATWLAADEITRLLEALNGWDDAERVANDSRAAILANDLGKAVSAADHRWPQEEKPHFVTHMRCGGCEQMTLKFRPPRWVGDFIKVDCWCGYELTEDEWSWAVLIIEAETKAAA